MTSSRQWLTGGVLWVALFQQGQSAPIQIRTTHEGNTTVGQVTIASPGHRADASRSGASAYLSSPERPEAYPLEDPALEMPFDESGTVNPPAVSSSNPG